MVSRLVTGQCCAQRDERGTRTCRLQGVPVTAQWLTLWMFVDMIEPPILIVCASSVTIRHHCTCVIGLWFSAMPISSARTSKVISTTSHCATDHAVEGAALFSRNMLRRFDGENTETVREGA